jgi:hypothetical protein
VSYRNSAVPRLGNATSVSPSPARRPNSRSPLGAVGLRVRFGYEAARLNVSERLEPVALVFKALDLMRRSPPFNVLYRVGLSKPR